MQQPTIQLCGLSTGYHLSKHRTKVVAQGIDATIYSGELTCLLGANGIGKSTLLRTLSAFQPPLQGEVRICGRPLGEYTERELSQLVSVVLTERTTIRNMTAYQMISIGRSPYTDFWGRLSADDKAVIDEAIGLVQIEHLAQRDVDTLSDGERQKVMIAKALAQQTPIILLDEPTAFLDFPSKVEMMQLLHRISRKANKTIFLSTHDLELALQIADKIWLVSSDAHIHIGTPEDLALEGKLSHFFARKGIVFDETAGLFRIQNQCHTQVHLSGGATLCCAMVRKALLRHGIAPTHNENNPIHIHVTDKNEGTEVLIHYGNHTHTAHSIGELLSFLTNHITL